MKGNDGSGNIVERDVWQTPQKMWDVLNQQYNFDVDCCASKENTKCSTFFTMNNSFLDFAHIVDTDVFWMNPPFSEAHVMFQHFYGVVRKGVAIYRCDNLETKIWQDIIFKYADWVLIPKGRICYEGMEGKGSRFPSALIGVGVDIPKDVDGVILKITNRDTR